MLDGVLKLVFASVIAKVVGKSGFSKFLSLHFPDIVITLFHVNRF